MTATGDIFQLILILVVSLLLASRVRSGWLAGLMSFLCSLFLLLEIASIYLGGGLIDYKFYVHSNASDVRAALDFFETEAIIMAASVFIVAGLMYFFSRKIHRKKLVPKRLSFFSILIGLVLMSLPNGAIRSIWNVAGMVAAPDKSFEDALHRLGMDEYTMPAEVEATPGKNIIVISMESLERGFLDSNMALLTPNLRRLSEEMTRFDMPQSPGSDWTSGSLYTWLTGVPAFFKSTANEIFQYTESARLTSISHVLKQAGYDMTYFLGNPQFSGMADILLAYGIKVKSEKNLDANYKLSPWGLQDVDLFEEVKKEASTKAGKGTPFALFLSTTSTHHPDGIYDERMEGVVAPQKSNLEFMAAATDYLVGDLINFLDSTGILKNTTVYIFPDHILMGQTARVLREFKTPRGLYVITNANRNKLSLPPNETLYQMDLPNLILEGAEVTHNARFLTDFVKEKDKQKFIKKNRNNILTLNEASVKIRSYADGFTVGFTVKDAGNGSVVIKSGKIKKTLQGAGLSDGNAFVISFDKRMRIAGSRLFKLPEAVPVKANNGQLNLILGRKDGVLYGCLNKGAVTGMVKQGTDELSFSKKDLTAFSTWSLPLKLPEKTTRVDYASPFDLIYVTSTPHRSSENQPRSEIRIGNKSFQISRGVNVLSQTTGNYSVARYDTFADSTACLALLQHLEKLAGHGGFYVLVADDSAQGELQKFSHELSELGYEELAEIKQREAYLAFPVRGLISEYRSNSPLSFIFPMEEKRSSRSHSQFLADAKDVKRFIAHAGGQIDHHNYTNSLEALNLSYERGFRLFELDIIQTSDSVYVAAHDWDYWASLTGYRGKLPVSAAEFQKHKIKRKYTPLTVEGINAWFQSHSDAILVTDKVNEPAAFARQFIDKRRLMMELFSLEALREGLASGIASAMPSQSVIEQIEGDKTEFLKKSGVKDVTVSRRFVEQNFELFRAFKNAGIRTYVFHVNRDLGKDENYVAAYQFDDVFGMYADLWRF
jgi:Sulfatase